MEKEMTKGKPSTPHPAGAGFSPPASYPRPDRRPARTGGLQPAPTAGRPREEGAVGDGTARGRRPGVGGPGARLNRGRQGGRDNVLFSQGPDCVLLGRRTERVVVCVDDTDDTSGLTSTGNAAEVIARSLEEMGARIVLGITRHQLLLAEGIAYTSHNSAMAFEAQIPAGTAGAVRVRAAAVLERLAAPGSDPGLCVARVDGATAAALASFGRRAQCEVIAKDEALALAARLAGVHLSEHGGTGAGVIGALAGAGLRLGGDDGRFRGQWDIPELLGVEPAGGDGAAAAGDRPPVMTATELVRRLSALAGGPVSVLSPEGVPLSAETPVRLGTRAKPVLRHGTLALIAVPDADELALFDREQSDGPACRTPLPDTGPGACKRFVADADAEERPTGTRRQCCNCLHRRWRADGFQCMLDQR